MQSGLAGNPGEEAGDDLAGELAEAVMDLLLQSGKAGGIVGELLSPKGLLLLELKGCTKSQFRPIIPHETQTFRDATQAISL